MSQYGYGGRANPYAQQDSPAGQYGGAPQQNYGAPQQNYGAGYGGGYGDNVEMTPLTQAAAGTGSTNPLDEIRDVGNGVNAIDQNLNQLRMLQDRALNETDSSSGTSRQLDQLTAETMANYRGLVQRLKELKGNKQAQSYRGQIDRLDRQLKERIQQYQQLEASHRQKMQGQMERQYRIVRPDADAGEVRAAVEDMSAGGQQVFQQAMMQSNRQGQARAVLNEVQNRHQELLKIEQQMTELTNMIIDLDTIIVQQEPMVQQIDEHVEKTQEDLKQANVELDTAVDTARSTRKKKWICCGICVAIVLVIVIIVVVYFVVTNQNKSNSSTTTAKRSLVDMLNERSVSDVYAQSKIVAKSIAGRLVVPGDFHEVNAGRVATLPVANFEPPN
ncbi:hypothetical protein N0V93_002938 [Gnomoniopsis smithogilvyi]|uniref:t-SNARE coiled-coil homology domain-containing protein n=1 Tax=Gnomoniopsis smithogilvyi TaxID=1191159 RepID=A0A9W8YYF4_9PEZI|nr:hypothetical protein N0V93_002938 [Gnomoniopsis smithogilvyi]